MNLFCTGVMLINSVYRKDENCYPKVLLEKYNFNNKIKIYSDGSYNVLMILINKFQWRKLQQKKSNEENWIYKFTIRKCKWVDRQSSWNMESIFFKRNIINFCFSGFFKLGARKSNFPKYYKFFQSLEKSILKHNEFF